MTKEKNFKSPCGGVGGIIILEDDMNNDNDELINAAWDGRTNDVITLINGGADVNANNSVALRVAAWNGHTDTVIALLEHGADVNADDSAALRLAANDEIRKILEEAGAK